MKDQNPRGSIESPHGGLNVRRQLARLGRSASRPHRTGSGSVLAGLDAAYQRQLATLGHVRRASAALAISGKQLELRIGRLEAGMASERRAGTVERESDIAAESAATQPEQLANLRRQYTATQAELDRVFAVNRRLQDKLAAFHVARQAAEDARAAAEEAAAAALAVVTGASAANRAAEPW